MEEEGKPCFRIRDKLSHVSLSFRFLSVRASVAAAKPPQFIRSWRQLTGLARNKISLARFDPVAEQRGLLHEERPRDIASRGPSVRTEQLESVKFYEAEKRKISKRE